MHKQLFFLFCLFLSFWAQAQNHTIEVDVLDIYPVQGEIHIGLYNTQNGFPEVEHTFKNNIVAVTGKTITIQFEEVPAGTYCVSLFHDKNTNGKFDFSFFGFPLENYGFSKNIFHRFRAPTFQECSFYLNTDKQLKINLNR